jgi:hypothetical protein
MRERSEAFTVVILKIAKVTLKMAAAGCLRIACGEELDIREWKGSKLINAELQDVCSSPNIIWTIKSRRLRSKNENCIQYFGFKYRKERDHLRELGAVSPHEKTILIWSLRK